MLAPAALEGYKQLSTTLTITAQYPDENDESFKKWVKEIQAKKVKLVPLPQKAEKAR